MDCRSRRRVLERTPQHRVLVGLLAVAMAPACATTPPTPGDLRPPIIPHAAWDAEPPVGHAADATRRNLAPGGMLRFGDLTLTVRTMRPGTVTTAVGPMGAAAGGAAVTSDTATRPDAAPAAPPAPVDGAVLALERRGERVERTVEEDAAFNWGGYHIAVLAVHAAAGELGGGLVELEVATVASLPPELAAATRAGDATHRLRIPHEIDSITLHHEGSAEPLRPEDDPAQKLRDLQAWGRRDRNWWDVPYHFLIDLEGNIYEGRDVRYMGETNTTYDPHGHLLISVLGNYNRQRPTAAQIEAITNLMAWAVATFDVPLDRIRGHGDLADTSCPGRYLRKYLDDGTFLDGVRARLGRQARAAAGPRPKIAPTQENF